MMRKTHRRFGVSALLAIMMLVGSLSMDGTVVHAGPASAGNGSDPLVVVATFPKQTTCKLVWGYLQGTQTVQTGESACPADSVVGSEVVRLSQAAGAGQAYVILPSQNASAAVLADTQQQIVTLLEAKGAAFRAAHEKSAPATSVAPNTCGGTTYAGAIWGSATWELESLIYWQSCGSTVHLVKSTMQFYSGIGAVWWYADKYASGTWYPGCPQIGFSLLTDNINSTHNAGYYYEPWADDNGNNFGCVIGPYEYVNIGPLN